MEPLTSAPRRGFTLVELLVAILLFALLSAIAYRGLDAMARANERVVGESELWQAITLTFERFAADVSQPSARTVRSSSGSPLPQWWGRLLSEPTNADAQLEFTRKSPPGQDDVRLAYRLRANTVELLIWPMLDRGPASEAQVHPLLENVSTMRFRYLDSQGRWQDSWPVTGLDEALPRAVSFELTVAGQAPVQRLFALP
jgi:general secretion pathway protein J